MRAIVHERYGEPAEVLSLREIERPIAREGEVLVRTRAASVHPDVWHVVRGLPYIVRVMGAGLTKPRDPVPGTDLAGVVESTGPGAARFRPGDEVYGEVVRGHQWHNGGAFAEFAAVREDRLAPKPAGITFEQAASVPTSALIAVRSVRDEGRVRPGMRVLVNGAGGGVGHLAVQLAKADGAEVTGVDRGDKLDMLRSIGADHVIDHTREDYTRGGPYDLVIDVAGGHSLADSRRALAPNGAYIFIGHDHFGHGAGRVFGSLGRFVRMLVMSPFVSQRMGPRIGDATDDPLAHVSALIESGALTPVVGQTFPLERTTDAMARMQEGGPPGKIVITM